jgi:hypothetical protein
MKRRSTLIPTRRINDMITWFQPIDSTCMHRRRSLGEQSGAYTNLKFSFLFSIDHMKFTLRITLHTDIYIVIFMSITAVQLYHTVHTFLAFVFLSAYSSFLSILLSCSMVNWDMLDSSIDLQMVHVSQHCETICSCHVQK